MKMIEYVDLRLNEWAHWYTGHVDFGLGYPKKTITARLIDEGGILINGTGRKPSFINNDAEETDELVCELASENMLLANCLREKYFGRGTVKQQVTNTERL
ncbi:MAG: hypothetical protein JKY13_00795, partial [Gammaproteobacteria bacterium]|nr:hypothetical protein [Gammaproteobacteria bacterium]